MQVELNNFRCWKKKTFHFNEKGIILINGSSGSGKSSILNAIYFAITGIGNKIVTNGEKKCCVKITFEDSEEDHFIKEIIRTKSPSRLTVLYNNILYEDDEAQKIIENYFGNNFQQTSYMTQKMIHSFLTLSSTEKMNFLQKYVLDSSELNNNTFTIKKKCKDKIIELKKLHLEHKSKINLYENELMILQKKFIEYLEKNMYNESLISDNIGDFFKNIPVVNFNPSILKELKNNQNEITILYQKYKENIIKKEEYNIQKQQLLQEIKEYSLNKSEIEKKINLNKYKGDKYFEFLNECKRYYSLHNNYEILIKNVEINCNNVSILINKQIEFYKKQIDTETNKKNTTYEKLSLIHFDIEYIKDNIEKWKKSTQTIIEYCNYIKNISKKVDINKYNIDSLNTSITVSNSELEEYKNKLIEKQEQINKLKNDWNLKNKLHKCPSCNIYIRIQPSNKDPNKVKLVEDNCVINKELNINIYNENINKFQEEITILNDKINNKQKELYDKETIKNELIEFNTKYDNYKKRINRADIILIKYLNFHLNINENIDINSNIYQKKIEDIDKLLNEYNNYNNEICNYEILISNILGIPECNICEILEKLKSDNLNDTLYINNFSNNIKQYINTIKDQNIKKMFDDIVDFFKKIVQLNKTNDINNISNIKPTLTQEEVNYELIEQSKYKINNEYNIENLKNIETKINTLNKKLLELDIKLNNINDFINMNTNTVSIEDRYYEINKQTNDYYELEQNYNKYIKINEIYNEWKRLNNEKKISNYLYDTVSDDIIINEMFLNKINESESIALTQCIDNINYYINEYLEKFFPNDSIIVDIVPFKEKVKNGKSENNDIKPVIDIKVCYKGEEIELSSLSGGEYDRVSLAIMLSFNNLSKSNMILLDESISSLDADLTNDILTTLKDNLLNKRIIVVAHQLSTGLFDQIINTI